MRFPLVPAVRRNEIADSIHVWRAQLDRNDDEMVRLGSVLSSEEQARADRFHFPNDRNRFRAARGVLRELLGGYLQQDPAELQFRYGEHGKPALSSADAASRICFNVSHSSGLAVYAIAKNRNLGIDVEHVRPDTAGEDIARRYFSAREVSDLEGLPPAERGDAFFRCWTRKEAYMKALGFGLQIPLESFAVSVLPGRPAEFLEGVEPGWRLAAFEPMPGFAAAIAYDGAPCSIHHFSVDSD